MCPLKVEQVPLSMLTDLAFRRSWAGRLLGYGTFIVTTPRGVKKIRFLPYPEQLYLEVCGLIFKDLGTRKSSGLGAALVASPACRKGRPPDSD